MTPPPPSWVMADSEHTWYRAAACHGAPTELFFPDHDDPDPTEQGRVAEAKALCAACPVREACLAAGMGEHHGIWGGLTPRERRALRRRQGGEAA